MDRRDAFMIIKGILLSWGGYNPDRDIDSGWTIYEDATYNSAIHITERGDYGEYQIYVNTGFDEDTFLIDDLLFEDEDYERCWKLMEDVMFQRHWLGEF